MVTADCIVHVVTPPSAGTGQKSRPGASTGWETPVRTKVGVSLAQVLCVYGTLVGIGAFGTRVRDSGGGAFRDDATLIAPGVGAFAIWTVIYLGLFGFTVWVWLGTTTKRLGRSSRPSRP